MKAVTQLEGNNESWSALLQHWNNLVFALLTAAVLLFSNLIFSQCVWLNSQLGQSFFFVVVFFLSVASS